MSTSQPPRRFKPEPVETTTTSSKDRTPRRFAPEPIETSTVSSKERNLSPKDHSTEGNCDNVFRTPEPKTPRKFAVEPMETSHSSNSKAKASPKPHTRFAPQLIETSDRTHRPSDAASEARTDSPMGSGTNSPRRFAPQLIETAKRSRKAGVDGPAVPHSDRTDAFRNRPKRTASDPLENSPYGTPHSLSEEIAECRRLGKPLPRRQGSADSVKSRSHSFYVPDLDPIASSESERSDDEHGSSMSTSSADSDASGRRMYEHATRMRESVDGRSSGYFLALAARAAEKQMRDQALAAFANDDRLGRQVDHYVDQADDTDASDAWSVADGASSSATKYTKVNWAQREMQKHADDKAAAKAAERARKEAWRSFNRKTSASSPWGNAAAALYSAGAAGADAADRADGIGGWQETVGLAQMRKSARPPMLGADIEFPRCPSPDPARFDVTQGSEAIRRNMCYLSEQSEASAAQGQGLLKPKAGLWGSTATTTNKSYCESGGALWTKEEEKAPPEKGLWAGCCLGGTGTTPPRGPTGLMTPLPVDDDADPMDTLPSRPQQQQHHLPPSPPPSASGMCGLDEKLQLEAAIDDEFDDAFVTQLYNYLSLGYPSMARKFDAELAKIARVEVSELRADDAIAGAGARGYIRLGEENGVPPRDVEGREVKEEHCARWRALRAYVREWARQQPSWQTSQYGGGVTVRRGSWAW